MAILKRFKRLLEADLHGILDTLEDPEAVLTQALRDMESVLEEEALKIQQLSQERDSTTKKIDALKAQRQEAQEHVTICITHKDDALSKVALRKRLELDRIISLVTAKNESVEKTLEELKKVHQRRLEELTHLKERATYTKEHRSAPECDHFTDEISESELELALLSEKARLTKEVV